MTRARKLPPLRNLMDPGHKLIADLIGAEAACVLAQHFGGEHLYIAKKPPIESRVVRIIGMTAAEQLAAKFGGDYLDVPLGTRAVASYLDRRKVDRNEIARLLRRGRSNIASILNELHGAKEDLQLSFPIDDPD